MIFRPLCAHRHTVPVRLHYTRCEECGLEFYVVYPPPPERRPIGEGWRAKGPAGRDHNPRVVKPDSEVAPVTRRWRKRQENARRLRIEQARERMFKGDQV